MSINQEVQFKGGDIICVSGKSLFKNAIAWFSRKHSEDKVYARHIAGMKNENTVSEALLIVEETNIDKWIRGHKKFEIWRYEKLEEEDRESICNYLDKKKGSIYGGWKLFLFALDFILTKMLKKDIYIFRGFIWSENFPICSWLYSYAYDNIGYRFGDLDPNFVGPDTMHDVISRSKDWNLVYRKG